MPKRIHICPIGKYPQRQEIPARLSSTKLRHSAGKTYVKATAIKNNRIKINHLNKHTRKLEMGKADPLPDRLTTNQKPSGAARQENTEVPSPRLIRAVFQTVF